MVHHEYVDHLYQIFREWVLTPPSIRSVTTQGLLSENYRFSTLSHGAFRFYAHQFYCESRKCVPKLIKRLLNNRSLAYWFMDDGSIKSKESKGIILNTQAYRKHEVEMLVNILNSQFRLKAKTRKQKQGHQIYISGKSYERFCSIVQPYIIKGMQYKLPPARRT